MPNRNLSKNLGTVKVFRGKIEKFEIFPSLYIVS